MFGGGGYLAVAGLLGVALGTLLRHTVAAVLAVLGLGFGATVLAALFPAWLRQHVLYYLPGPAGNRIIATNPPPAVTDYLVLGA